jgi:hypothetical protein
MYSSVESTLLNYTHFLFHSITEYDHDAHENVAPGRDSRNDVETEVVQTRQVSATEAWIMQRTLHEAYLG